MTADDRSIKPVTIGFAEILPLKTMTLPPYTTTNTIFYGEKTFAIIDPAPTLFDQKEILRDRILTRLDRGHAPTAICLTHHHGDHVGAAEFLSGEFSLPIVAHRDAARKLSAHVHMPLDGDGCIELGQGITLSAIHTPGHADGHLVFIDEAAEVLMAGDMITDRGTILIPPSSGSLIDYMVSLERLTRLSLKLIIPAHGEAISDKPQAFLLKALLHRYERLKTVLDNLPKGADRPIGTAGIAARIYGQGLPEGMLAFANLSVESSLLWLATHGLAREGDGGWRSRPSIDELTADLIGRPLQEISDRLRHA